MILLILSKVIPIKRAALSQPDRRTIWQGEEERRTSCVPQQGEDRLHSSYSLPYGAHHCPFHLLTTFPSVQFPEAEARWGHGKWELRQVSRRVKDLLEWRLEKKRKLIHSYSGILCCCEKGEESRMGRLEICLWRTRHRLGSSHWLLCKHHTEETSRTFWKNRHQTVISGARADAWRGGGRGQGRAVGECVLLMVYFYFLCINLHVI